MRANDKPSAGLRDRTNHLPQDEVSVTARGLTWGYLLGLGLLALVTLAGGTLLSGILQQQADDARIINQAGAQRALSQRIAGLSLMAAHGPAEDRADAERELSRAALRMAASHAELLRTASDPIIGTAALKAHYLGGPAALDAQVTQFLGLVQSPPSGPEAARDISILAFNQLLPVLHQAVALHEADARERGRQIVKLHRFLVALALLLLLAEALLIFRPLVRRTSAMAARLRHEAVTDPLTGLMNRRAMTEALGTAMQRHESVAVIAVDLDHFKEANDAEGHAAGDALLRVAAERLRANIRKSDIVGRVGGDEFVAFLLGIACEADAMAAAQRLRDALHQPVAHRGRMLRLGATLGVALAPMDADQPDTLLRAADEALIRAKRKGRGTIGRATPDDAARVLRDAAILRALKPVHEAPLPGLVAHLQPIVSLADGSVRGLEALARWHTAELGQVPPDEFFTVAQRAGLATLVSRHVRGQALASHAALRRDGLRVGRLALNLSAAELLRDGVVEDLEEQCASLGLELNGITIEITEDALLDRVAHTTLDRLAALRGRGAHLSLDDFGTGTSGLAQLLRLPLDEIKLDRSFTRRLGRDGRAERIIEGTIRLAHSLGLEVVAEGIEDAAQAHQLCDLGCEMGQGWLYAPALPEHELRDWLAAHAQPESIIIPLRRVAPAG